MGETWVLVHDWRIRDPHWKYALKDFGKSGEEETGQTTWTRHDGAAQISVSLLLPA